ncbi:MAG: AAA family ATPase, partial [Chloroflexota bacterium]
MAYNLEQIRKLLNDAFSADEVKILAFDRFNFVYENYAASQSKNQLILTIIERAYKHGRVFELLEYIKEINPKTFNDYLPRLKKSPQTSINHAVPSTIPPQPFFIGRQRELNIISEAITPEARTWGVLIDGPGGIGKTALAIRSAHLAPSLYFDRKIFLSAKIQELTPKGEEVLEDFMLSNYSALLAELAYELGQDQIADLPRDERAKSIRRVLANINALIIIDNLETFDEAEQIRMYQFLSRLPLSCKAIVTSRQRSDIDARIIRLDRLPRRDALTLINELAQNNRYLKKINSNEYDKIYRIANGNPLLIRWLVGQFGREGSQCRTVEEAYSFLKEAPKGNDPLEYIFGDLLNSTFDNEFRVLVSLVHFKYPLKVELIAKSAGISKSDAHTACEDLVDRALLISDESQKTFVLPPLTATFLRRAHMEATSKSGERLKKNVYNLVIQNGYNNYDRFHFLEKEWPMISASLPLFILGDNNKLQQICDALQMFFNYSGRWKEWLILSQQAEKKATAAEKYDDAGWRAFDSGAVHFLYSDVSEVRKYASLCQKYWSKSRMAGFREQVAALRLQGL